MDWFSLIQSFRFGPETRGKILENLTIEELLNRAFKDLTQEKDEILKYNLLIFIQENLQSLSQKGKFLKKIYSQLLTLFQKMRSEKIVGSQHLQGFVIETITCLIIRMKMIESNPEIFNSFVKLLIEITSNVNNSKDRVLRGISCQCLKEFEIHYKGLLTKYLKIFFAMSKKERTHVFQSYYQLIGFLMVNSICLELNDEKDFENKKKALEKDIDFTNFNYQKNLKTIERTENFPKVSNALIYKQIFNLLLNNLDNCTEWSIEYFLKIFFLYCKSNEKSPKIFLKHYTKYLSCNYPIFLFHSLLNICQFYQLDPFINKFRKRMLHKLFIHINDLNICSEQRFVCFEWLLNHKAWGFQSSEELLSPYLTSRFYPKNFDSISIKRIKLLYLPRFYYNILISNSIEKDPNKNENVNNNNNSGSSNNDIIIANPPNYLIQLLVCIDLIKRQPKQNLFTVLITFLSQVLLYFQQDLYLQVEEYLYTLLINNPNFIYPINSLINRFNITNNYNSKTNQKLHKIYLLLLHSLNNLIDKIDKQILNYLPLIRRLAFEKSINPSSYLIKIYNVLKSKPEEYLSNNDSNNSFVSATQILEICKIVMLNHSINLVFHPVGQIYDLLSLYHSDVVIRDMAFFYRQSMTHVSTEKLNQLFSPLKGSEQEIIGYRKTFKKNMKNLSESFLELQRIFGKNAKSRIRLIEKKFLKSVNLWPTVSSSNQNENLNEKSNGNEKSNENEKSNGNEKSNENGKSNENDQKKKEEDEIDNKGKGTEKIKEGGVENKIKTENEGKKINIPILNKTYEEILFNYFKFLENSENNNTLYILRKLKYIKNQKEIDLLENNNPNTSNKEELKVNTNNNNNDFPKRIYSIEIRFETHTAYKPIPTLTVPFLVQGHSNSNLSFPYVYDLVIEIKPIIPIPTKFDISILFNIESGQCLEATMKPLQIQFEELLQPVHLSIDPFTLFNLFWNHLDEIDKIKSSLQIIESVEKFHSAESIKAIRVKSDILIKNVLDKLDKFIIKVIYHEKQEQEEKMEEGGRKNLDGKKETQDKKKLQDKKSISQIYTFMFLPPKYHLLLKFEIDELSTIVKIKTDFWLCLRWIDEFINNCIFSNKKKKANK
ncbi:ap-5 complex subunit beta-1 [Anaeramoeba flamelloides]|uniref:Ap-5 complex subunit beta-1 n=1 Tax=Anaeramoeba flamelloides TaxID=1746091 RepID=A0AAV7YEQ5_9EUKA|nr:ap-5 complex subunit beta-1 [Anaeramoeba flamelloides]